MSHHPYQQLFGAIHRVGTAGLALTFAQVRFAPVVLETALDAEAGVVEGGVVTLDRVTDHLRGQGRMELHAATRRPVRALTFSVRRGLLIVCAT